MVASQEVFQANLPRAAAFACAGPVANNKCEMTNLSWVIDGDYLSEAHGIRYCLGLHPDISASARTDCFTAYRRPSGNVTSRN